MVTDRPASVAVLSSHRLVAQALAAGLHQFEGDFHIVVAESCCTQLPLAESIDVLIVALTETDDVDDLVFDLREWLAGQHLPIVLVRNDAGASLPDDAGLPMVASVRHDYPPSVLVTAIFEAVAASTMADPR